MGIWSTVGGIAGGIGGFAVGGPAGAMLGYAGGSQLGKLGDDAQNTTNSGGRMPQGRNRGVYGEVQRPTMNEATRASQMGADQAGQTRALGQQLGVDAYHGQTVADSYQRGAAERANGLYGQAAGQYGAAEGNAADAAAARGNAMAGIGRLQQFYQQGPGPSAAQAQLRAGQDSANRNALALAHTGAGGANSMRAAMRAGAAGNQQANQASAGLRANEEANWRQTQLGAMGQEQQALGNVRAGDASMMGQRYGAGGQMLGAAGQAGNTALGYGGLGAQYGQQNNQARLGAEGMAIGAGQFGEQQRGNIMSGQLGSDTSRYGADQGVSVGMANVAQRDRAADMAMTGSLIGSGVQMMGQQQQQTSDIRAKENIQPASAADIIGRLDDTYGRDEADVGPSGPRVDLRQARGYAYDYKDPSLGPNNQVGPMAQDLEKTAASGAVSTGPNGMKQVDPGRLTMTNTAAIGEQQRRLDALETMLDDSNGRAARDTGPRTAAPAPSAEERDRRMMTFGGVGSLRPEDAATLEQRYPKPKRVTPQSGRRIKGERA